MVIYSSARERRSTRGSIRGDRARKPASSGWSRKGRKGRWRDGVDKVDEWAVRESQFQLERALTSFLRLEARAPVTRACEGRQRGLGP